MLTDQTIDPNEQQKPFVLLRPFIALWHWMVPPSQAHMDRQSRTAVLVRSGTVVVLSLGLIVVVLVWGRDLGRMYKDWRAGRLVTEARSLADEGNVLNAVLKAQEAYSMAPTNTDAIRLNAQFLTLMKRQEAVYFSSLLEKRGKATPEDIQLKVRALMNLNRQKEASDALGTLMRNAPPSDEMFKLAEDVWKGHEQDFVIIGVLKEYCAKNPTDNESLLRLAKFQVASPSRADNAEGMSVLWRLSESKAEVGIKAVDALGGLKSLGPDETTKLINLLEHHPRATGWHEVEAMKLRIGQAPSRRTAIIQQAVEKYQRAKPEDRVPFVRWLVLEREFRQVLALVDQDDAKTNKDLLENYMTALTLLGKFDELTKLVEDPKVASILNKTVRAFYRAHLAFVTGSSAPEVREKLIAALIAAQDEGRGDMLLGVASYAEKRAMFDVAEDAFRAASQSRRTELQGFEGLLRMCQATGNLQGLIESSKEAVRRWPDNENFVQSNLYGTLISGQQVELSLERTLNLLAKHPDDSQIKLAAALGYYWFGDLDMTANHMQHVDLNKCTPGQQAVFAYLAKRGGYDDAAGLVIKGISPAAKMLPQEQEFFNRAKQTVQ